MGPLLEASIYNMGGDERDDVRSSASWISAFASSGGALYHKIAWDNVGVMRVELYWYEYE